MGDLKIGSDLINGVAAVIVGFVVEDVVAERVTVLVVVVLVVADVVVELVVAGVVVELVVAIGCAAIVMTGPVANFK